MVTATYVSNLVTLNLFETTANITAYGGGGAGLSADPDFVMEGTNSVNKEVDAADKGFLYGSTAGNFVIGDHDHLYVWIMGSTPGLHQTRDNGGIHVDIGDSNSAFVKFHVDGFDTLPFGGGTPYTVRYVNTTLANFRTLLGSPGTTPDSIGGGITTTATVMGPNLGVDAARIGSAYTVLFGTSADPEAFFDAIATDDDSTSEGVFQPTGGGFNLQGKLRIGNGASECELLDSNTSIFILDTLHSLQDFSEILVAHESTILTLTNITFTALAGRQQTVAGNNPNRGRFEMLTPIIDAQGETDYDNSPTSEGTFVGGTGYSVADVITMSDDSLITVDSLTGSAVLTFTVNAIAIAGEARSSIAGTANTQISVAPAGGSGFTLTPDVDNLRTSPTVTAAGVGFIGIGKTVLDSGANMDTCRWVGADQITANGATLTDSTVEGFEDQIIIDAQDETSYDGSPSTEGSFVGGTTGHVAADILTMSDGTLITVDTVVSGAVTEFTVDSSGAVSSIVGVANTMLITDGAGDAFTLTPLIDNMTEVASLQWLDALDPNGETDGMDFTKGTNPTHALEFGVDSPLDMTLTDVTFNDYGAVEGDIDTALWFRRTSDTITLGISGGTNPSFKSDGATIVITNAVTVTVQGVTEGAAVSIIANETVGTITVGDIILEALADSNGEVETSSFNYEGAFDPSGLDVLIRARQQGIPNAAIADDNGVFTDETLQANDNTDDNVTLLPVTPVVNQDTYIWGHAEQFGKIKVNVSTAGTGGFTITWQYNATGDVWTNLSDVVDGTSSFSVLGRNEVSFTIPGDWLLRTLNGQGPYFYIRAAYTAGSVTITPLARKATLDVTRYLPTGDQTRIITSSGLTTTVPWVVDTISTF